MSIVHKLPETPKEGSVVYADNGKHASDRAVFKNGKFYGGGEFPFPSYEMTCVTKWFYLSELKSGSVSFERAENM